MPSIIWDNVPLHTIINTFLVMIPGRKKKEGVHLNI